MKAQTYLSNFEVVLPKNKYKQSDVNSWIKACHIEAEKHNKNSSYATDELKTLEKLFDRYAIKDNQIAHRYLETSDALPANNHTEMGQEIKRDVYEINAKQNNGSDILQRTMFFSKTADEVMRRTYFDSVEQNTKLKPDHLIHVTCTGYISPSPAQKVVTLPEWNKTTAVTHAYHMGCYAALPAIRIAQGLVAQNYHNNSEFRADIFHTEMCGLHMNALSQTPEQFIVQSLFADGHIKYTATTKPETNKKSLKVLAIHEQIIPDSQGDMSWAPTSWGLQMNLSREVPQKIKSSIKPFLQELMIKAGLDIREAYSAEYAIHPGGPKIIDTVKEVLELSEEKVQYSKAILLERGNMSSATLPHVWERMLKSENIKSGTRIISFAFGPGLTVFGAVMEVVHE